VEKGTVPFLKGLIAPPESEEELLSRAWEVAGLTLGELGAHVNIEVPDESVRAKGIAGQILEKALGASAGSRAEPDFVKLGVELKTIPLDASGKPKESTFVCSISLAKVLFVPVEAASDTPLRDRRVGRSYLWAPTSEEERLLRTDWERLAEMIAAGDVEQITGHLGEVLQVRPKAPHGRSRRRAPDEEGAVQWTMPRGFYLRPAFTGAVLARLRATR
jgi:DNA mismatch repair protein MutH